MDRSVRRVASFALPLVSGWGCVIYLGGASGLL